MEPFILNRADPFVVKAEDCYYFTASVPKYDHIELRKAATVDGLAEAPSRIVWARHEQGEMSEHIWAPEIHRLFGKWYIYFAAGRKDDIWEIRPYVLECAGDPMTGEWRELGRMQPAENDPYSFTDFSLDATVFTHNGEHYFVWAEKVGRQHGISNLYISRLAAPNRLKDIQVLLTTPDYDWERVGFWVNEGPSALLRDGKVYLTYSAAATGAMYCMGMLTARLDDDLLDPRSWKKERYPVLSTDASKGIYGPGHNSFTEENGKVLCIYHARDYEKIVGDPLYDPNRHARILEVAFEDGKPIFRL